MANEADNVLIGQVFLSVKQPRISVAKWSQEQVHDGETWSVKLAKLIALGGAGSTHLQLDLEALGITMAQWTTDMGNADTFEYWKRWVAGHPGALVNFEQVEFRFEDPDSEGWVEVTALPAQNQAGNDLWAEYDIGETKPTVLLWGKTYLGGTISYFTHVLTVANCQTDGDSDDIDTQNGKSTDAWILTRMRFELYEDTQVREMFLGDVRIHGTDYTVEPGGTAPGMSLSSPYVDVGYSEDGLTFNYTADVADIRVEEETYPIGARLVSEGTEIVCNLAESSLANLNNAIPGSVLSGNILTLGGGVMKEMAVKLTGLTPDGLFIRTYEFPKVVAVGPVSMSFRRADKAIFPITLRVLKPSVGPAGTFVDNTV